MKYPGIIIEPCVQGSIRIVFFIELAKLCMFICRIVSPRLLTRGGFCKGLIRVTTIRLFPHHNGGSSVKGSFTNDVSQEGERGGLSKEDKN